MENQHWRWVDGQGRWAPCLWMEALIAWVEDGEEIAWGRRPPLRRGVNSPEAGRFIRGKVWVVYIRGIRKAGEQRRRIGTTFCRN